MARVVRPILLVFGVLAAFLVFGQLTVTKPFVRFCYPDGRPNRAAKFVIDAWSWLVSRGFTPARWPGRPVWGSATFEVRGRRSGKPRSTVATWIECDGERYFVSMTGEGADWVKNLRAAGGEATLRRRTRRPVRLGEVPVGRRAPIIRAWYQRTWRSTRRHLSLEPGASVEEFRELAPRHPVFRIVEVSDEPTMATGEGA